VKNLHDLQAAYRDGRATITADEAYPVVGVSRAAFYRSMAAGEVPGVLKLGRKRLLSLPAFLAWIDPTTDERSGCRGCHE
jgi:predicted DNA-binding transcriptional regulator AlpA